MPNFSLYLPDNVLEHLDNQRGSIARSRVIREILQVCIQTEGYLGQIVGDIARITHKDQVLAN